MRLNENILSRIIAETINEFYRDSIDDYDEDYNEYPTANASLNIDIEDFIRNYAPECELKKRLEADDDYLDDLSHEIRYSYTIKFSAGYSHSNGDYWNEPYTEYDNPTEFDDDGLYEDIQSIQDENVRNLLAAAYKNLEDEITSGGLNDYLDPSW